MRTWSIESVLRGLERITRPPRRTGGFDEDAAGESLSVSRTYTADEANAAIERQMVRDGLITARTCRAPDPSDCLSCGASVCRWPTDGAELVDIEAEMDRLTADKPYNPSTLDDVLAQLCQLTYFVEDLRNIIQTASASSAAGARPAGVDTPSPVVPPAGTLNINTYTPGLGAAAAAAMFPQHRTNQK